MVRFGSTRGARYGLAWEVASLGSRWPLYRIDASGTPRPIGPLFSVAPDHYHVRGGPARMVALSDGLPYYLQDARPAGFLGRAIPAAHPDLGLPLRVQDWSDDHVLAFLTRRGSESVGDLILGTEALDRHLSGRQGPPLVDEGDRATRYPQLADAAMAGALAGSSAQGKQPKFAVLVNGPRGVVPMLVKFSPPRGLAVGERWSDLLVADEAARLAMLDVFAELIGNTDRHFGNVSLFDEQHGPFTLAPVYDMLPMLFAPADGQLVERAFAPGGARADTLEVWPRAQALALEYWDRLAGDARLSAEFRQRARGCREIVAQTTMRGAAGAGRPG